MQFLEELKQKLNNIVGKRYLLTDRSRTLPYSQGYRLGSGEVYAVVRPGSLLEIWHVLNACHSADVAIIMQAANTGLTGGSTPNGNDYDRPIVIISTLRVDEIHLIDNAKQIVGLAGSTLFGLEDRLMPYGREPHSVIGSSCIGASIVGGICNNSGGALLQRGPAYTELALFAQVSELGELCLVNNLGIELGDSPEEILNNLEQQNYTHKDIQFSDKLASDNEYHERVREIDAPTPSRFNNDGRRLHDASGCAGKLAVFAVRLDTFPKAKKQQVFYLGTNDPAVLTKLRRDVLANFKTLPVSAEYFENTCYEIGKKYGKDTVVVISKFGSKTIPKLFTLKRLIDRYARQIPFLPDNLSEHLMQWCSALWVKHLPDRMEQFADQYQHHLIVETNNDGVVEAQDYFQVLFSNAEGDFFACTEHEAKQAILQRFTIAGAIGRYYSLHRKDCGDIMTIDVALPRNERQWLEQLPQELEDKIVIKFYYGHFFCHVMHQNYIMKKGVDAKEVKQQILESFDARGAEYPAEHNVGHEYAAKEDLKTFYKECDPTNAFNPGIGQTSKLKNWR